MSWEFERSKDYIKKRDEVIAQLQSIDENVRTLMLADFIVMYNAWNWKHLVSALKKLGVENKNETPGP